MLPLERSGRLWFRRKHSLERNPATRWDTVSPTVWGAIKFPQTTSAISFFFAVLLDLRGISSAPCGWNLDETKFSFSFFSFFSLFEKVFPRKEDSRFDYTIVSFLSLENKRFTFTSIVLMQYRHVPPFAILINEAGEMSFESASAIYGAAYLSQVWKFRKFVIIKHD